MDNNKKKIIIEEYNISNLSSNLSGAYTSAVGGATGAYTSAVGGATGTLNSAVGGATAAYNSAAGGVTDLYNQATTTINNFFNKVKEFFENIKNALKNAFNGLGDILKNGILSILKEIWDLIWDTLNEIPGFTEFYEFLEGLWSFLPTLIDYVKIILNFLFYILPVILRNLYSSPIASFTIFMIVFFGSQTYLNLLFGFNLPIPFIFFLGMAVLILFDQLNTNNNGIINLNAKISQIIIEILKIDVLKKFFGLSDNFGANNDLATNMGSLTDFFLNNPTLVITVLLVGMLVLKVGLIIGLSIFMYLVKMILPTYMFFLKYFTKFTLLITRKIMQILMYVIIFVSYISFNIIYKQIKDIYTSILNILLKLSNFHFYYLFIMISIFIQKYIYGILTTIFEIF